MAVEFAEVGSHQQFSHEPTSLSMESIGGLTLLVVGASDGSLEVLSIDPSNVITYRGRERLQSLDLMHGPGAVDSLAIIARGGVMQEMTPIIICVLRGGGLLVHELQLAVDSQADQPIGMCLLLHLRYHDSRANSRFKQF